LIRSIHSWTDTWNQHPRPFVWTKTADEILDKIPRYLQPISNSGHWTIDIELRLGCSPWTGVVALRWPSLSPASPGTEPPSAHQPRATGRTVGRPDVVPFAHQSWVWSLRHSVTQVFTIRLP
jgi:hypothetical protein